MTKDPYKTPGGKWLPRPEPPHVCPRPSNGAAQEGDLWQCDCGIIWKVVWQTQYNESWKAWERQ